MSSPTGVTGGRRRRSGFTLVELLVTLLLGALVVHLAFETLSRLGAARARIAARADALVAARVTRHVLRRELRFGDGASDWLAHADSLSLRAFRGAAVLCRADSAAATVVVSFVGDRAPDPSKDSVLLFTEAGDGVPRALLGTAPTTESCARLDTVATLWRLDAPAPPGATAAKLFERGSYHLSGAALRYRRGAGGRQPLTPEVWAPATRWTISPHALGVDLMPLDTAAGPGWRGFLAAAGGS